jgi:2'-5' RNA ligase
VTLGDVETFIPVTPTVYIRVEGAAARMSELHNKLNTAALAYPEEWPYIPHLTIAKMNAEQPAQSAFQLARTHWAQFSGTRRILLERLTFVREEVRGEGSNCWVDLAPVLLGRTLVPR